MPTTAGSPHASGVTEGLGGQGIAEGQTRLPDEHSIHSGCWSRVSMHVDVEASLWLIRGQVIGD